MKNVISFSVMAMGPLLAELASAHHSVAMFDLSDAARESISGTVVKWEWQNPHSWIFVEVTEEDGTVAVYGMELSSPHHLRQAGFRYDSVTEGDEVTIEHAPVRDGGRTGLLTRITWHADGRSWEPSGAASPLPPPGRRAPGQGDEPTSNSLPLQHRPPE